MLRPEQPARASAGKPLDAVDDLAAGNVAAIGVTACVLVDEHGRLGLDGGARAVALGRDQVGGGGVACRLPRHQPRHLVVGLRQGAGEQREP